jgi:citronellyl-CoA synthetase
MVSRAEVKNRRTFGIMDILPGLLKISPRIPSMLKGLKEFSQFDNQTPMSMGRVIEENAVKYGHRPAIFYENQVYTHTEFNAIINQYAHYFLSRGIKKKDPVIVMVDNRPELLMIIAALSKIGAVSSLINPNQRGDVLKYSINLTRGRHFIVGEELLPAFEEIKQGLDLSGDDTLYFQPEKTKDLEPGGYINLAGLLGVQPIVNPPTTGEITVNDPYAYVFTSGTTGLPKASVQTHRRWLGALYFFGKIAMDLKPEDIFYCPLPFCHTNGLGVAWGSASANGSALVVRRKFSASHFLDDVRKYKATSFIYIGEICRYLLNQPRKPDDVVNTLVSCVGNGLRPEIWKEFKNRFGIKKVYELYGAAEGPTIFANILNLDCTVGICLSPHTIVRYDIENDRPVRDENGFMMKVKPGETGLVLIEISEGVIFEGYTDSRETEKKIFRDVFKEGDAWFNTGDLVFNQGYKHIQFVDRLGDTFRWKGENVSTSEVEKVISAFPLALGSTVYGVTIPGTDGRAGMAAIIPASTVDDFDIQGLSNFLLASLPSYATPKFIRLTNEFETTGTHKIKKTVLRDAGFDIFKIPDPIFVLLPDKKQYEPLTESVYQEILDGKHKF